MKRAVTKDATIEMVEVALPLSLKAYCQYNESSVRLYVDQNLSAEERNKAFSTVKRELEEMNNSQHHSPDCAVDRNAVDR
jgi:hypothetical protein